MKTLAATTAATVISSALLMAGSALAQTQTQSAQLCPQALKQLSEAAPDYRHEVTLSPYTVHWHPSEQHKPVVLLGLHEHVSRDYFCGLSLFSNSFGQPSATAYVGRTWNNLWPSQPDVYAKVAAGLMYGYKGEFQHKVPLNYKGFSPLVVPTAGYRYSKQDAIELQLLGNSALMFSYVHRY